MSFAYLKYSDDDHGGFKAAAARPYPHLHHQVQVQSCLNFSRYTLLPTRSPLPPSTSKLSGQIGARHTRPPRRPAGNCAWKQKAGIEHSGAHLLRCSVAPLSVLYHSLWSHYGSTPQQLLSLLCAACSDLPSLCTWLAFH